MIMCVEEILIMGNDILILKHIKSWLAKFFTMKDLGETSYILGLKKYKDT